MPHGYVGGGGRVDRGDWSYDDIILAAVLGSWIGAQDTLWRQPLRAGLVTGTIVLGVYCVHTVVFGSRRMRWVFALPTALAISLAWLELVRPPLGRGTAWQLLAIIAVWLASLGLRALGAVLRHLP